LSSSSNGKGEIDSNAEIEFSGEVKDILGEYEFRRKRHGSLLGLVVSQKCSKSVTVRVEHQKLYPKYNAVLTSRKKIMAHDETEVGEVGDLVRIVPCRPMSKKKRFKVMDVLKKARRLDDSVRSPAAAAILAAGGKMLGVGEYSLVTAKKA
jgi:small subunit ribosomal protein S17